MFAQSRRWLTRPLQLSLSDFVQRHTATNPASLFSSQKTLCALSNSYSIFENLTAEEALLRGMHLNDGESLLLFYINDPCVVIGRNQNAFAEVSLGRAAREGVAVARRSSGGGAVYHDRGNLCLSFFTTRREYAPEKTIEVVRLGLSTLCGIDKERFTSSKRSDLFLDGHKITGSAMRVQRDIAMHHCTLLVSSDTDGMGRFLHSDGHYDALETSAVQSVRSPVTSLLSRNVLPCGEDAAMNTVTHFLAHFFEVHGTSILLHDDPHQMHVHHSFPRTEAAPPISVHLGVQEMMKGFSFVYAEGRNHLSGDTSTFEDEVRRLRSGEWLLNMPKFTTTIGTSLVELRGGLSAVAPDLSARDRQEVEEYMSALFSSTDRITVRTTVALGVVDAVYVNIAELNSFLNTMLVGCKIEPATKVRESVSQEEWTVEGFALEMSPLISVNGDHAKQNLQLVLRAFLHCWEKKNTFRLAT
ncbi:lipoate-protein ligase A [Angomonas deanei]|nr:lipoate-protein ligase A [Angomonas deanei]|eukprot:EPY26796.1 lipoate-protein ligase A [Angomonas deanei]